MKFSASAGFRISWNLQSLSSFKQLLFSSFHRGDQRKKKSNPCNSRQKSGSSFPDRGPLFGLWFTVWFIVIRENRRFKNRENMWWTWPMSALKWNKFMCWFNFFKEIFFSLDFSFVVIFGAWFPKSRVNEIMSCEESAIFFQNIAYCIPPTLFFSRLNPKKREPFQTLSFSSAKKCLYSGKILWSSKDYFFVIHVLVWNILFSKSPPVLSIFKKKNPQTLIHIRKTVIFGALKYLYSIYYGGFLQM